MQPFLGLFGSPRWGALMVLAIAWAAVPFAAAQNQGNGTNVVTALSTRSVGGIAIDTRGMLSNVTRDDTGKLRRVLEDALQPIPDGMNETAGLRKVSLARLEAEIRRATEAGKPLSDAICCLAGLQQIRYVLAYPDQKDIVLIGPGEGWKADARGTLVGAQRPARPSAGRSPGRAACGGRAAEERDELLDRSDAGRHQAYRRGRQPLAPAPRPWPRSSNNWVRSRSR